MALKAYLESLEGIPADVAKEYKKVEIEQDGKKVERFTLDLEGAYITDEPVDALKRARDYEKKEASTHRSKVKELTMQSERLQEELDAMRRGAIPKGDVEGLEKSWAKKLQDRETALTAERDAALGTLRTLLVDNVAVQLANKITVEGSADLMIPHIKGRLTTEHTSEGYVTRVLDAQGKPSAMSIEELQKDLSADPRFKAIIRGSKASGSGASGANGNGSGAPPAKVDPKFDWNKAKPGEIAAQLKARKEANQT